MLERHLNLKRAGELTKRNSKTKILKTSIFTEDTAAKAMKNIAIGKASVSTNAIVSLMK